METTILVYIYLFIAILIRMIPFINVSSALINTLLHEVFHVICAAIFSGRVRHKIRLERDGSGLAITNVTTRAPKTLIYLSGYVGSSISALLLFYFLSMGMYKMVIYFIFSIVCISLILWIRNVYGICWAISLISLLSFIIYLQNKTLFMHTSIFLSDVVFIQSIFSAFTVCKLSIIERKNAGDATSLANETYIPAVIWGLLFFAQALFIGYFILSKFII